MSDAFIGQVSMFAGNFAPRGFAMCDGATMSISQYQALYSLIGTTYGGDGRATFKLPDLRSRLPVHYGQGQGLSQYVLGMSGGDPSVTITIQTLPSHSHAFNATKDMANSAAIANNLLPGQPSVGNPPAFYGVQQSGQPPLTTFALKAESCGLTGGGQPHTNLMPSLCITFIICLDGIFPSRN
jgi:microcystin-dependent protein